jgi:dTMP kinase
MKTRGIFISLEGVEGVGKSTALKYVESLLQKNNIEFQLTREPGGTALAERIRDLLLDQYQERVSAETELLLMFAARSQNVSEVIKPALAAGKCVVADRFVDASYAYQGGGRGIDIDKIDALTDLVMQELRPDVTLLLDAPVEVGLKRMAERLKKDRIESETIEFFERVRQQYLALSHRFPDRYRVIDAEQDVAGVQQQILVSLEPFLPGGVA